MKKIKTSILPELSFPRLQLINYTNLVINNFGELRDISEDVITTSYYYIKGKKLSIESIADKTMYVKGEIDEIKILK